MKRILVTGASGFIGRQTVLALRGSGDEVHSVQHTARQMSDSRNHTANLLDPRQVTRLMERVQPTHLIHLAWYTAHGQYWSSQANLDWVAASLHLFQEFTGHGGQRAVFAGTCAEYDWSASSPLHETNSPGDAGTLYGTCKNALRLIIEKFAMEKAISVAWGRIFFVYGPGENSNRLVPSIIQALNANEPVIVFNGGHLRNLMHVSDVGRALVRIMDSTATGVVNIAGREQTALGEVARMIGEMMGKQHLLRIEQAKGSPQNPRVLTADTDKLFSLGFAANYPLREGLAELVREKETS